VIHTRLINVKRVDGFLTVLQQFLHLDAADPERV